MPQHVIIATRGMLGELMTITYAMMHPLFPGDLPYPI